MFIEEKKTIALRRAANGLNLRREGEITKCIYSRKFKPQKLWQGYIKYFFKKTQQSHHSRHFCNTNTSRLVQTDFYFIHRDVFSTDFNDHQQVNILHYCLIMHNRVFGQFECVRAILTSNSMQVCMLKIPSSHFFSLTCVICDSFNESSYHTYHVSNTFNHITLLDIHDSTELQTSSVYRVSILPQYPF